MDNSDIIGLDFETYGGVNLIEHGLERYAADKTFRPLIACVAQKRSDMAYQYQTFDFVEDFDRARSLLAIAIEGKTIAAHNAGFERRVLQTLGLDLPADRFIDSAVVARAAGAGGKLEAAAPQLLGMDKMEDGRRLIMLFSVPSKEQQENGDLHFDKRVAYENPDDWRTFIRYCQLDARLSLRIATEQGLETGILSAKEQAYQAVTMEMNQLGWPVDVDSVEEMQRRYLENQEVELAAFREKHGAYDLNLNSLPQLKEWCHARGIKATSFDEKNVAKLMDRIARKLDGGGFSNETRSNYHAVWDLLNTKRTLGGSSLKKLQVILDTVGADGRLRDQYLHIGAGQSWRTTGRSVQMQNLKRLAEPAAMETLEDPDCDWSNDMLAENIRQTFTSSHPDGMLIVGDFASVESRGLAWLANEHWKLDAYREGRDMYKVLAESIYGTRYDFVTKAQRQTGKVGELSCGYGAGGGAVQAFAENMGVTMTEAESSKLVTDWRAANPQIVRLWNDLDDALHFALESGSSKVPVGYGWMVWLQWTETPASLTAQHRGAKSLRLTLLDEQGQSFMVRVFHGCYERGRNICYYKPSQLKNGDLWSSHFTDPKTKQVRFHSIYGGKLAGILTQSFCRELFFQALLKVHNWTRGDTGVDLIGQFHDEIVLDWWPTEKGITLPGAESMLNRFMSQTDGVRGFPMAAEIKHDHRYTK